MVSDFYFRIPRRARLLIFFIAILLAVYFLLSFLLVEPKSIPPEFLEARREASLTAKDIVALSSESANSISEIANLDQQGRYQEALALISRELENNRQARNRAINLSVQLEKMARNIDKISPTSAAQLALQAVSSETTLISRLISYNDYLNQLLEVLRAKFAGRKGNDGLTELINKINNEAMAINDLNTGFNDLMKEFDSSE